MIALAAMLALILAAGGPTPTRRPRGPAIARNLCAAALDADRAWRDAILAPVRLHAEMERLRDDILIDRAYRGLCVPVRVPTPIRRELREVPPLREWVGVAA